MKEGNAADQLQVNLFTIWEFSRHGILLPRTCSHLNFVIKYQSFKDQFFVIKIKKEKKTFNYQKAIKEIHHLHQIFLASYQKQRQSFQYMFFGHTFPPLLSFMYTAFQIIFGARAAALSPLANSRLGTWPHSLSQSQRSAQKQF